jgi:hypothetical protein
MRPQLGGELAAHGLDAAGRLGHGIRVLIDGPLVERVDLGRVGHPPAGADHVGDPLERRPGAAGQDDPAPSRAKASATAPPIDPPPP